MKKLFACLLVLSSLSVFAQETAPAPTQGDDTSTSTTQDVKEQGPESTKEKAE